MTSQDDLDDEGGRQCLSFVARARTLCMTANWCGPPVAGRRFEDTLARWLAAPEPTREQLSEQANRHERQERGGGKRQKASTWGPTCRRRGPPFVRSTAGPAMFVCGRPGDKNNINYCHWVDDGVYYGNGAAIQRFEQDMTRRFGDCKERGAEHVLGLTVRQKPGHIHVSMPSTIDKITERFLNGRQTAHVPINPNEPVDLLDCHTETEAPTYPYREAAGSAIWCSVTCRPDISYAIGQLTKVQARPGRKHWQQLKQLLAYLHTTKNIFSAKKKKLQQE